MRVYFYEVADEKSEDGSFVSCKYPTIMEIVEFSLLDDTKQYVMEATDGTIYTSVQTSDEYTANRICTQLLERDYADLTRLGGFAECVDD